jgi:voltage-gated sodium channel
MVTMFIVLTGENWNTILMQVMRSKPESELFAIIFFVSAMLICNFMLLNLFLAILLKYLQDVVINMEAKRKL